MSWLSRFLPARTLDAISPEGAHVDVEVIVASPDVLTSPIAPTRAAAIHWTLLESGQDSNGRGPLLHALVSGWRGAPLLVRWADQTVEIPLDGVRFHTRYLDPQDGVPLQGAAATVYRDALAQLETRGMLHLRELPLTRGQHLRMKAFVVPTARSSGSYREASSEPVADLRAVRAVHLYDWGL